MLLHCCLFKVHSPDNLNLATYVFFLCPIDTQHRVYMKTRLEDFDIFIQVYLSLTLAGC